ncbi:MAG TPA: DUF3783 domain-containing protein [Spirochaetales bacterium]|nr:DUF3783 domain-containing protein [Spirochaetales bacterium]
MKLDWDTTDKLVLMHGLTPDEALKAMRAVKTALGFTDEVAFALTTEHNMEWKVAELVEHVLEEHRELSARRPSED